MKRVLPVIACLLTFSGLFAQDIHFSQYFASPLTLNPAQTGEFRSTWRGTINYRNQWASIPAPFVTYALSYDMSILNCKMKYDHMGLGFMIFTDKSGNGALSNFTARMSYAYHKALDADNKHKISLGAQLGTTTKRLDFTNLFFESQYDDGEFNPDIPSEEPFETDKINYLDMIAGIKWTSNINQKLNFNLGYAMYHISRPAESFLGDETNDLGTRISANGSLTYLFNDKYSLSPSVLYMSQSGASSLVIGTAFGYQLDKNFGSRKYSAFYLGAFYRNQDAILLFTGVDYQRMRFGFSYDVTTSGLKDANFGNGGFEISLAYIGDMPKCRRKHQLIHCPRF